MIASAAFSCSALDEHTVREQDQHAAARPRRPGQSSRPARRSPGVKFSQPQCAPMTGAMSSFWPGLSSPRSLAAEQGHPEVSADPLDSVAQRVGQASRRAVAWAFIDPDTSSMTPTLHLGLVHVRPLLDDPRVSRCRLTRLPLRGPLDSAPAVQPATGHLLLDLGRPSCRSRSTFSNSLDSLTPAALSLLGRLPPLDSGPARRCRACPCFCRCPWGRRRPRQPFAASLPFWCAVRVSGPLGGPSLGLDVADLLGGVHVLVVLGVGRSLS